MNETRPLEPEPFKKWAVTAEHSRWPNWVKQDLVAAR